MNYDFRSFQFGSGKHATRDEGMCVMEAVAYVAGEHHTDSPVCACPVLSQFLRSWNDALPSDAERNRLLAQFVFRLPGTRASEDILKQRAWMVLDWLIRANQPAWFDLSQTLKPHAEALRSLPQIDSEESMAASYAAIDAASMAASNAVIDAARYAASMAASYAAIDAAIDAARYAAIDAAIDAASMAAIDAASYAAIDAASYAAIDAAIDHVLAPVVLRLQQSACELLDRMIRLTEIQELVPRLGAKRAGGVK